MPLPAWLLAGWALPLTPLPDMVKSALLGLVVTTSLIIPAALLAPSHKLSVAISLFVLGVTFLAAAIPTNPAYVGMICVSGAACIGLVAHRFGWHDEDRGWPPPLRGVLSTALVRRALPAGAFGVAIALIRLSSYGAGY